MSDFYDRISRVYDLIADQSEHAFREEGVRALAPSSGEAILEIGFGTGHALVDLAKATAPAGRTVGVELSLGMLQVARRRLQQEADIHDLLLLRGDGRHLPLPPSSFDAAFLSFTFELFSEDDMRIVLAELERVLRSGGRIGIVSMAEPARINVEVELYKFLHRHFPHVLDCRPIDGSRILREAGLEVVEHHRRSVWGLPVDILVGRSS